MKFKDIKINQIVNLTDDINSVGVIDGIARTYDTKYEKDNLTNPIVLIVKFVDNEFPRKVHPNNLEIFKG